MTGTRCEHETFIASETGPGSLCAQCGELLLDTDQAVVLMKTGQLVTLEQARAWLNDHPGLFTTTTKGIDP